MLLSGLLLELVLMLLLGLWLMLRLLLVQSCIACYCCCCALAIFCGLVDGRGEFSMLAAVRPCGENLEAACLLRLLLLFL